MASPSDVYSLSVVITQVAVTVARVCKRVRLWHNDAVPADPVTLQTDAGAVAITVNPQDFPLEFHPQGRKVWMPGDQVCLLNWVSGTPQIAKLEI